MLTEGSGYRNLPDRSPNLHDKCPHLNDQAYGHIVQNGYSDARQEKLDVRLFDQLELYEGIGFCLVMG